MPAIKYTFYNTTTQKQEEVEFYNYCLHLEKFGFLWRDSNLEFWYSVIPSTDKKKLIKRTSMGKSTRKKLFLDESRIWNLYQIPCKGHTLSHTRLNTFFMMI